VGRRCPWAYLEVYVVVSSMTPMLQDFLLYRQAVNRRRAQDAAPPRAWDVPIKAAAIPCDYRLPGTIISRCSGMMGCIVPAVRERRHVQNKAP
jgi:hypothetical protein